MTDENSWASPGDPNDGPPQNPQPVSTPPFSTAPFTTAPFSTAPPPPPPFGQPFGGAPTSTPPAAGAWAPPPKPGLIPLAPMTLGTILGAAFRTLRRNPRPIVGFSLVIHGIIAVATIFTTTYALTVITHASQTLSGPESATSIADVTSQISGLLVAVLAEFATLALGLIGSQILQGIVSLEVSRGTLGEKLPLRALWARARGRLLALVGWAFALVGAFIGFAAVATGVSALLIALAAGSNGNGGLITLAVLGTIILSLGGAVVAIWVGIKVSLVPSALVIERLTLGRAIGRSWRLTRGFFWRTFGILLLVGVMIAVASQIVQTPVSVIGTLISGAGNPTGSSLDSLTQSLRVTQVVSTIVMAIISTVTAIISTAVSALIYIDLRIRKEGLDLQLMRFVDARQAGNTDVADPYLGAVDAGVPSRSTQPPTAPPPTGFSPAPPPPGAPFIAPPA